MPAPPLPLHQDFSQRITVIETKIPYIAGEVEYLSKQITELDSKFDILNTNVALLIDQRDKADKGLARWKTAALSLTVAIALGLIAFLGRISWVVQTSRAFN